MRSVMKKRTEEVDYRSAQPATVNANDDDDVVDIIDDLDSDG